MEKRRVTKKEQRQNKQFVEKLLLIENKKYEDWLNDKHEEYIQENNTLLLDALEKVIKNNEVTKTGEQNHKHKNKGGNY